MGLFDKIKGKPRDTEENEEQVVPKGKKGKKEKKVKQKKERKGKKQKGLIESMGLNEAVASMGLSILEDLVNNANKGEKSAVRSVEDGYTVLVITEDMLQKQGMDLKSEDFGGFAHAISSQNIQTILLKNDLDAGVLTIVPDRETLDILDEFSIVQDMIYMWGILPHDADDESTVIQLANGASLGDLNVIADEELDLVLKGGKIFTQDQLEDEDMSSDEDAEEEDADEPDLLDEDDDEVEDADEYAVEPTSIDFGDDDEPEDDDLPYDVPDDDDMDESAFDIRDDDPMDDDEGDLDDILGGYDVELPDEEPEEDDVDSIDAYDLQSEEEGRQMITGVLSREFQNDELGVVIPADPFNQQFGDIEPILFDEQPNDDSSLAQVIAQMRHDANIEILNVHNTHLQNLRSHYQNGLATAHDRLAENLNYKDSSTAYGKKFVELTAIRSDNESRADELIARNKEALNDDYSKQRGAFGERAKQEALAKFDDQNKSSHDKEKQALNDQVYTKIQVAYDGEVSDLYDERRQVAKRLFDKMTTGLLLELQKMFTEKMKQEHDMYDQFRQSIDAYARDNYSDEVLRAKALATQQRQHHEADDVRTEYELMLSAKQRQLEESELKAAAKVKELELSRSIAVKDSVADYKRQVERQTRELNELREDARTMQDKLIRVDSEKDKEYSHRLKTANDEVESQRKQVEYEQSRADKQGRQSIMMLAGMVIVGIALGLIIGFLIGTGNSGTEMAPGTAQEQPSVSYNLDAEDETSATAYHAFFNDDAKIIG